MTAAARALIVFACLVGSAAVARGTAQNANRGVHAADLESPLAASAAPLLSQLPAPITDAPGPPAARRAVDDPVATVSSRASSDDALLASVKEYARRFVEELTFAIASEHYEQEVRSRAGSFGRTAGIITARRTTESEVRLAHISDAMWLMARTVLTVDGVPVDAAPVAPTGTDIRATESEVVGRMRDTIAANTKWNIGRTKRNINVPTLVMWFLTSPTSDRFRFAAAGTGRSPLGASCTRLKFEERSRPVLINADRGGAPASGTLCVLPESGAVVSTQLTLQHGGTASSRFAAGEPPTRATIEVGYAFEPKLGLWVPTTMTERYEPPNDPDSDVIVARATYSDYRRFVVSAVVR